MIPIRDMARAYDVDIWGEEKGGESPDGMRAMRAALREAERLGWKMVPVEPTMKMVEAGETHVSNDLWTPEALDEAKEVYRAMMSAAPGIEEG